MKQWLTIYVAYRIIPGGVSAETYLDGNGIEWDNLLKNTNKIKYPLKPGWARINVYVTDEEATLLTLRFG